ncbi:MAG TPA: alpha/beta hydrolase [Lacipirellulaceae bacterium]|nr:alpha/beta hydrolase [Lacipirellulaceae bacterium]
MSRATFLAFFGLFAIFLGSPCHASEPITIPLWKNGAPGKPATKPKDEPVLYMTRPTTKPTTTAVIILPGGGYGGLAISYEGHDVADWFNSFGVTAFVLKYRMHGTGHRYPVPMMDGRRAIRTVRARAAELGIDPSRIGVLGFSAGGHLASTLGTHFDKGNPSSDDPIERVGSRPDFLILCYPVISMESPFTHRGSRENLLGKMPDPKLVHNLSNEIQVTPQTPPTFIFQTSEDRTVPAENAVAFFLALHKAGVPAEMHIFQKGKHGVGLAQRVPGSNKWPELCHEWLKVRGLLQPETNAKD